MDYRLDVILMAHRGKLLFFRGSTGMHDVIFAVAFVAMIASPAMVASIGGRKEDNPGYHAGPATPPIRRANPMPGISVRPVPPAVRPRAARKAVPVARRFVVMDGPTLPMHNARGMAGR